MGFVQTIAFETTDIGPVQRLLADWHTEQSGVAPGYLSNRILSDQDRAGRYLIIVEFSSAAEAARNNDRPETAAWAAALTAMITGDAEFAQYDDSHRIPQVQPDVTMVLQAIAEMNLPPVESMSAGEAREFSAQRAAVRPPGPEVGEIADGSYPGANGELNYRLYRPDTAGPHPVVLYFHGGGWVLGSHESDDPMCRDLCVRTGAIIVSCDYRHAPEHRFPAAPEDGFAALGWVSDNVEALGGRPGPVVVCGWSAGGNVAAVACQMARDAGGPEVAGQVLLNPVVDSDLSRPSYTENAEGFIVTRSLMVWFWDHYADPADRTDPRVAAIRGNLANLPPAVVFTAEFDPLRDEGSAYVEALRDAGVEARHVALRGHIHTTLTWVDVVPSSAPARAEVAIALRELLGAPVTAG